MLLILYIYYKIYLETVMSMPMTEQELRQAVAEIEAYKGQMATLARQEEILRISLQEYMRSKETLLRFRNLEEGKELLIPIGGDTFIYAKVSDSKKAMIGIGVDLIVDRSTDDAIKALDDKIEQMKDVSKKVAERMAETEQVAQALSMKVQEEFAKYEESQK